MNLDIITRLVQILKDAPEVGAIEIRRGLFGVWSSVRVSKRGTTPITWSSPRCPATRHARFPFRGRGPGRGGSARRPASQLLEIKSRWWGRSIRRPSPGPSVRQSRQPGLVGQVVCIIEAMKIMNEIESELHGVIREVAVENTQPVEFGQVLYRVDPNG